MERLLLFFCGVIELWEKIFFSHCHKKQFDQPDDLSITIRPVVKHRPK